jgi:hypothetical protein
MKLIFSAGNSKLGNIPNFSLPPIKACVNPTHCFQKEIKLRCYAAKFYNMYPNVKKAWDTNYESINTDLENSKKELKDWFNKHKPEYFRIHVGGDFYKQEYFNVWCEVAKENPATKFLAFTKNYALDTSMLVDNLSLIYSIMPNTNIDTSNLMNKKAFTGDKTMFLEDPNMLLCPTDCRECKYCWDMKLGQSVLFHIH